MLRGRGARNIRVTRSGLTLPRLLDRSARGLQLTPDGQLLLGYAQRILDLEAEAKSGLGGERLTGRVRLGVPDDYAARYLTPMLRRFAPRHSGVEIELVCKQSPALIPRVTWGDLDLALISRDNPRWGTMLFHEPLVWVRSPQFELWRRDPLPVAVYEDASLARRSALNTLAKQGRHYKLVYNSCSLAGQLAAVESGLAVAVLTQCSVPAHLQVLGSEEGLGPLEPMQVAVYRSTASRHSLGAEALHALLVTILRLMVPS